MIVLCSISCRVKLQLQKEHMKINAKKETNWLQLEFLSADQAEFCWKWLLQHFFLLDVKNNFYV